MKDLFVPIGKARVCREGRRRHGRHLRAHGARRHAGRRAARAGTASRWRSIDLRSLSPVRLGRDRRRACARRNRVLFLNEDTEVTNFGEHLLRRTVEELFYELYAPPRCSPGRTSRASASPTPSSAPACRSSIRSRRRCATSRLTSRRAGPERGAAAGERSFRRRQYGSLGSVGPVTSSFGRTSAAKRSRTAFARSSSSRAGMAMPSTRHAPLPRGVGRVGHRVLVAHAERRGGRDERVDVDDLAVPRDGLGRIVLDLHLEGVDIRLRPLLEGLAARARRVLVGYVNDESADDGVVVLAVAVADEALDPPELHAGPVAGVGQEQADAVLPVGPPVEPGGLELLERGGVLQPPLTSLGGLPVVLRWRGRGYRRGGPCRPARPRCARGAAGAADAEREADAEHAASARERVTAEALAGRPGRWVGRHLPRVPGGRRGRRGG